MTPRTRITSFILMAATPLAVLATDTSKDMNRTTGQTTGQSTSQTEAPPMFKELDKNRDGQISQSEAKRSADVTARFSTLDSDKDKQISVSEWQADDKTRGAAGVSGESREQGEMKQQQPSPGGRTGDTQKPMGSPGSSY